MKKTLLALALAGLSSTGAMAAEPAAAEPEYKISGNFGLFSDYRFRGASQTDNMPALQGGFDFTHASGAYLGTWTSNVSQWANLGGSQEIDFYGGYRFELSGVSLDVGAIAYVYPKNKAAPANGTNEFYLGVAYGPASYKISKATGNWFGIGSDGATYHDLTLTYGLSEKVTLSAHVGYQDIKAPDGSDYDFTDYKLALAYDLGNAYTLGLAATSMSFSNETTGKGWFAYNGSKLYESTAVLSISKTF